MNAARHVGITSNGLSVDWMQQEKCKQAQLLQSPAKQPSAFTPTDSPKHLHRGWATHWNAKYEISIEEIPGFPQTKKWWPKKKDKKSVQVTQVCGSLIAQNVLQMSQEIKEKKNYTYVRKVGHTSKFLFGIYWWT